MARVKRSRGCPWKVYLRETNASRRIDGWKKSSDPLMETESRLGAKSRFPEEISLSFVGYARCVVNVVFNQKRRY